MLLLKAELVNVCQHVHRVVEFGTGITTITGPNGAGKSNLLGLIRANLTNDYSHMAGVKDDNVYRGAEAGDSAYTQTWWQTPAGEISIRRGLQRATSILSLNGEEVVSAKENAITEQAMKLLGTSEDVINGFMFADFNTLRQVVIGNKSERMKMFTSLCGIERIGRIVQVVSAQQTANRAVIGAFDQAALEDNQAKWNVLKQRRKAYLHEMQGLSEQLPPITEIEALNRQVTQLQRDQQELAEQRSNLSSYTTAVNRNTHLRQTSQESLDTLETTIASQEQQLAVLTEQQRQAAAKVSEFAAAERKRKRYRVAVAFLAKPEPQFTLEDPQLDGEALRQERAKVSLEETLRRRDLKLAQAGQSICDKCGSSIDASPQRVEQLQKLLKQAESRKAEIDAELHLLTDYREQLSEFEQRHAEWKVHRQTAEQAVEELQSDPAVHAQEDQLQLVAESERLTQELTQLRSELQRNKEEQKRLVAAVNKYAVDVGVAETNKRACLERIAELSLQDYSELDTLVTRLGQIVQLQDQLNELRQELGNVNSRLSEIAVTLRRLRSQRRRQARLAECVEICDRLRNAFGRDRLQARAIRDTLQQTTRYVNDFLAQFAMPYRVKIDPEEYAFLAVHEDGAVESAARLSVGQSLALGISFWLARATSFSGQLPLFGLDEPTANLDDERVSQVAAIIQRLSPELVNAGRQGIVITHHASLAYSSTRTVNL